MVSFFEKDTSAGHSNKDILGASLDDKIQTESPPLPTTAGASSTTTGMTRERIGIIQNLGFWPFSLSMFRRVQIVLSVTARWSVNPSHVYIPLLGRKDFQCCRGFGPAAEALLFRQKDPKPLTPNLAKLDEMDARHRRARQLATLTQGPPLVMRAPLPWASRQASDQ